MLKQTIIMTRSKGCDEWKERAVVEQREYPTQTCEHEIRECFLE